MKKLVTLGLAVILVAGMLAGCGRKPQGGDVVAMKEGQTVKTVVEQIEKDIGIQMPSPIDDGLMKDMFYVDPATDAEEYFGQMSMSMTSADNVVGVKAKPGKKQVVVDGLTKRLEAVRKSFEQYLPDQNEKAKKGEIIEKGDYVFLVIIGQEQETFDNDMKKAKEIIDAAF